MHIFDIHAHIYPDAIAEHAVQAISSTYGNIEITNDGRLDTLLAEMDEAGVERFCAHSVATTPHHADSINRFVMASAKAHPDRIVPFGSVHPDSPNLADMVDELKDKGFRGIKLQPEFQSFFVDEPRAVDMFRAIAGKLPVLLHCGDPRVDNSAPERILRMLDQVPDLTLICAHLGGWTNWENAAKVLTGADIWVDTSSSLYALDNDTAVDIIRGYGVDRVLYGCDYPVGTPKEELKRFMALPLTEDEREKILWSNHLKLLGE